MASDFFEAYKDPRWQKKRLEIMERDGFQCARCKDKSVLLNVHHAFYVKDKKPWEYPDRLLVCLCESCHKFTHENFSQLKAMVCFLQIYDVCMMSEIVGFARGLVFQAFPDAQLGIENYQLAEGFSKSLRVPMENLIDLAETNKNLLLNSEHIANQLCGIDDTETK